MNAKSLLLAACAAMTVAAIPAVAQADVPLIPREKIFGNPTKTAGRLSPDGKWLSWIAPRDGVLNIYVAPAGDPAAARALTSETKRPIRQYFWSPDSKQLLFINDKGGDENFLLYGVDVASGEQRTLTPFEKTRVRIVNISNEVTDRILVGVNNRDPKWHDVHSLDLRPGKLTPVLINKGDYSNFIADEQLDIRIAAKSRPDGGTDYYRVSGNEVESKPFETVTLEDARTTQPIGFTADGKTLLLARQPRPRHRRAGRPGCRDRPQDARGRECEGRHRRRHDQPEDGPARGLCRRIISRTNGFRSATRSRPISTFLQSRLKGEFNVQSRTRADDKWIVGVDPVTAPTSVYLYDRKAKTLTRLYVGRPELEGAPLAAMHPVEIKTRDGLNMVSYLTLPPGSDPDGDGKPDKAVPMVLMVHGGPWGRDNYGYDGSAQWLANRGYAVLSPNFRASTGFGKKFISAGDLQWGRKMQDDLGDAVDWAVARGVTTADKVAIMGGSYGGYAVLAGLAFTPDKFACGVDIVGPSNLGTLLGTIPPYWEAMKAQFYKRMGDPNTPEGKAYQREVSPFYSADKISRPLLIGQGANDPRVNVAESQQIVDALKAKSIPVTYVVFPDEGHGFARPQNNIAFNAVAENFLAKCLGGRAEPIGPALKASSAQVPYGAEFAPGLAEALK